MQTIGSTIWITMISLHLYSGSVACQANITVILSHYGIATILFIHLRCLSSPTFLPLPPSVEHACVLSRFCPAVVRYFLVPLRDLWAPHVWTRYELHKYYVYVELGAAWLYKPRLAARQISAAFLRCSSECFCIILCAADCRRYLMSHPDIRVLPSYRIQMEMNMLDADCPPRDVE